MATQKASGVVDGGELSTARPWLSHYPAGVDGTIDIPDITLVDLLSRATDAFGSKTFATFFGRNYSYSEIDRESNKFANRLIDLGLKSGDPVILLLPNVPQFLVAAYGALKSGGIVAAVNPLLTPHEVRQLAVDSGANIIVTLDRFWESVEPLVSDGTVDTVVVTGVQDGLSTIKRWLYPLKYRDEMVDVPHDPTAGHLQYRKFIGGASSDAPSRTITSDQTAFFQYTGGTTGIPKAAVLSHANLVANVYQVRAWLTDAEDGNEVLMAILPFFHAYGGTLCLNLTVHIGATVVLVPRFEIKEVMEEIQKHKPTILPGVPTLYNALNRAAENNPERRAALRSIRYCVSGGAPLPPDVQRQFEEISGGRLVEGYGLSEASPVTHANPLDGRSRIGAIGLPLPNTEVRLLDPETGAEVEQGEPGELCIRGPQVMQGYWQRPDETAEVLDEEGWLHTGDMATMDEDGFFRIVDRLKDVIITGGENIYPREIEDVLSAHPKIHEVAVAGVKHEVGGEVAKAYIVLREGETMNRREVMQFCSEKLARYKVPRQVEFRDELPKSAVGKVLRRQLESSTDD